MKPFEIEISDRQYTLFRDAWRQSEELGDLKVVSRLSRRRVLFSDYEGVQHTLSRLIAVRTVTAADIRSWEAVKRKIDQGVVNATR